MQKDPSLIDCRIDLAEVLLMAKKYVEARKGDNSANIIVIKKLLQE